MKPDLYQVGKELSILWEEVILGFFYAYHVGVAYICPPKR
jgi:hypothetical protein